MQNVFFDSGASLLRTLIVAVLAYTALIIMLRLSGKRTLAKMNAFDFIVTVALGSTLATILLNKDVALAQGVLALFLLIGMQFAVTWTSVRAHWLRAVVTGEPTLLCYQGAILSDALRRSRVTEAEIHAAVRAAGVQSMQAVEAVVLETNGEFSVVRADDESHEATSLKGLER